MGLPRCITGFESINRYFDKQLMLPTAKIMPGEYYVTTTEELITTVLGSCISVCIYDSEKHVGGMNHFMLPLSADSKIELASESFRYGDVAMERLINEILKAGGQRNKLVFKAFGGGQIIKHMTSIGDKNIHFLEKFIALEGFKLTSEDLGGRHPRKVRFNPFTGQVWVKKLAHLHNDTIEQRETSYQQSLKKKASLYGDVDLFE